MVLKPLGRSLASLTGLLVCLVLGVLLVAPSAPSRSSAAPGGSLPPALPQHRGVGAAEISPQVAPAAAPAVQVNGIDPSAASVSWSTSTALFFTNYTLQQSEQSSAGPWETVAVITSASTTSYAVTALSPGTTYWWRVSSSSLGGTSVSNPANATTPGLAFLNVTLPSPTDAQLLWSNNATYGGLLSFGEYRIFEVAGTGSPNPIDSVSVASAREFNVTGLSAGASYAFYVNTTDCLSGCGGAVALTQSNVVTMGTPEPLVASLNAARPVVDVDQADLFTCTPSGGRSPYSLSWDNGNGSWAPGIATESFRFPSNGSPVVRCRIVDALSSSALTASALTVDPAPSIQVTLNRTALDAGGAVEFNCTASGGTSPFSITWLYGDGSSASTSLISHAYSVAGRYVASCTATDFVGVERVTSEDLHVSIPPTAAIDPNSLAAAPGTVLTFAEVLQNGSGNATAPVWDFGDGGTASGTPVTHAFAGSGNFSVTVGSTDSNGVRASSTISERISAISITLVPVSGLVRGESASFSANASGGAGGPYLYRWTFGDGLSGNGSSVVHAFGTAQSYQPTLIVTDRLGAAATFHLASVAVAAPPGPPPPYWLPLLGGLVAFGLVTPIAANISRRNEERSLVRVNRWVPPTDPRRTLSGTLRCHNCGTLNNAARESCSACGATVSSSIFD